MKDYKQELSKTNLVKVDLDATNIGRTDRHHTKESVLPPSEERDALVQDKEIFEPLGHPWRHREQLAFPFVSSMTQITGRTTYRRNASFSPQPTQWDCGSDGNLPVQGK